MKKSLPRQFKAIALALLAGIFPAFGNAEDPVKIRVDAAEPAGQISREIAGAQWWNPDWVAAMNSTISRRCCGKMWSEGAWPAEGVYDWERLDQSVESFTSKGLKLILPFTYVPRWLWSDPDDPALNETIPGSIPLFDFLKMGNTLPPSDYDKWDELVYQTVKHLNVDKKYGIIFEAWNEPNADWFWNGTMEECMEFYERTARAVKRADPNSMIGGPTIAGGPTVAAATNPSGETGYIWMEAFIKHCAENNVPVDFVSWHYYDYYAQMQDRANSFTEQAEIVRAIIKKYPEFGSPIGEPEFVIDEWGYDWNNLRNKEMQELINSQFHAAWVTQSLFEMVNSGVDVAAYTSGLGSSIDSPNPTFCAIEMFNRLNPFRIAARVESNHPEIGVLASRKKEKFSVMLWHFQDKKGDCEISSKRIRLALENIPEGIYRQVRFLPNNTRVTTSLKVVLVEFTCVDPPIK
jgi:hypothetical protein